MLRKRLVVLALILPALAAAQQGGTKRGITPEDYFSFELVSDPRISPDGSQVAYVVSRVDRAQNRRIPSIWLASTDGSAGPIMLINESWLASAPRWLPDGRTISFISSRSADNSADIAARRPTTGRSQLWTI